MISVLLTSFVSNTPLVWGFVHEGAVASFAQTVLQNDPDLPPQALKIALKWLQENPKDFPNHHVMTIINFNASSRTKRMHVIDLDHSTVKRYLVAHGKNSGYDIATMFSNEINSNRSSLGAYTTMETYSGSHGLSLRLRGLETSNNNAEIRDIVMHGADYVSDVIAATQDRLGRSEGCPAVDLAVIETLIPQVADGSLLYVYATPPQKQIPVLSDWPSQDL